MHIFFLPLRCEDHPTALSIYFNVTPPTITVYIVGMYYFPVFLASARLAAAGKNEVRLEVVVLRRIWTEMSSSSFCWVTRKISGPIPAPRYS